MTTHSITLMEAYIIENLRAVGVTNQALIQVDAESLEKWKKLNDRFDYSQLHKLSQCNPNKYAAIINNGYRVKFLTLNGLINLIELKLNKKRGLDFIVHDNGISDLNVSPEQLKEVQQLVSANWQLTESASGLSIRSIA